MYLYPDRQTDGRMVGRTERGKLICPPDSSSWGHKKKIPIRSYDKFVLWLWPSWIFHRHKKKKYFGRLLMFILGSIKSLVSEIFLYFPIWFNTETISSDVDYLGFLFDTKNTHFVKDHPRQSRQVTLKIIQWFR